MFLQISPPFSDFFDEEIPKHSAASFTIYPEMGVSERGSAVFCGMGGVGVGGRGKDEELGIRGRKCWGQRKNGKLGDEYG